MLIPQLFRQRLRLRSLVALVFLPHLSAQTSKSFQNSLTVPFVTIRPGLMMAAWETRVSDFQAFTSASDAPAPAPPEFPQGPDHPVVNVDLADARAFCAWLTQKERDSGVISATQEYRLPTNADWDQAVGNVPSATNSSIERQLDAATTFPWGEVWPPPTGSGNYSDRDIDGYSDGADHTAPVGHYKPTPQGIYDLGGNVWEWMETPTGKTGMVRGGSWMYFTRETLVSNYRYNLPSDTRASSIGFRICLADNAVSPLAVKTGASGPMASNDKTPKQTKAEMEAARTKYLDASASISSTAAPGQPYFNSLAIKFRPLKGLAVLVSETETTLENFREIKPTDYPAPPAPNFPQDVTHPIVMVTLEDANNFCKWLTVKEIKEKRIPPTARYRLPTDDEWSAMNGLVEPPSTSPSIRSLTASPDIFPWGTTWPPPRLAGNFGAVEGVNADRHRFTAPVSSYEANQFALSDLAGNVSEWTSSTWKADSSDICVRGSSWASSSRSSLSTGFRQQMSPAARPDNLGFRCVLDFNIREND